ncbi:ABA4-like family protein [Leptospira ilyithenensis]|uniref:DUF4281 domain-containing protein n=1 Tax=Leptospira ilyithenensis TaxID=2484901 RepID=A0A4R9LV26_9LEPT|nr:ABA4-like family protein [Leptospira ilyithenensis]TGN13157.1 DUF4281 domain-containing protein [Leptospira ilyithenensis]
MNPETVFQIASKVAVIGWLILIIAPNWKYTKNITTILISTLAFGGLYAFFIGTSFGEAEGGFSSLTDVRKLFMNDRALLAGWIHYLSFDLFIGTWEIENAKSLGVSRWFVLPCQILTFLFGPIGLLLYFLIRLAVTKNIKQGNTFA